jgi:YihY family inner membrane protein
VAAAWHPLRALRVFWHRAYRENITGLAAMVAYNLMLSAFPFALLLLFVFGQVLQSADVQSSVLRDLERLFPNTEHHTLTEIIARVRDHSTSIGIAAILAGIWIGASFWGAMDTAFCRIYHVRCRGWVEQKRWALGMLVVVALFIASTVAVPFGESLLVSSTSDLPFGLSNISGLVNALLVIGGLALTFVIGCVIYSVVPNERVPWKGVWPGALALTFALAILNWGFPFYLENISSLAHFGSTLGFLLIALIWFYAISLSLMAGAVINALRFEWHDTGELPEEEAAAEG